jgi:hypothetical protein
MNVSRSLSVLMILGPMLGVMSCARQQAAPLPVAFPPEVALATVPDAAHEFAARAVERSVPVALRDQAHAYIRSLLKHPTDARFKHEYATSGKKSLAVCGLVTELNGSGEHGDYQAYYVESVGGVVTSGAIGPFGADVRFANVCGSGGSPDPAHFAF